MHGMFEKIQINRTYNLISHLKPQGKNPVLLGRRKRRRLILTLCLKRRKQNVFRKL